MRIQWSSDEAKAAIPAGAHLPSLTDVAFVMPLAFLFGRLSGAATLLSDGDTGWHIRAGEWMLRNHAVPRHDLFSFTRPHAEWFAWEWLWDVTAAWLHQHGGLAIIVWASAAIIAITSALLFRLAVKLSGNALIAVVLTVVAAAVSSIHWLARPHLTTILFATVVLGWMERARTDVRWLAALPILTLLWTQLHGGFLVGVVFAAAYAVGECAAGRWRRGAAYAGAGLVSLAVSLVNPYGWRLHAHIAAYLIDAQQLSQIKEFVSLEATHPMAPWLTGMLAAGALSAFWHAARRNVTQALLLILWGYLAMRSARHIPLYMVVAVPAISAAAAELVASTRAGRWSMGVGSRHVLRRQGPILSLASLVLIGALLFAARPRDRFRAEFPAQRYPAAVVNSLGPELAQARVFTTDEWGDYLIYRLSPEIRVFIDGRSDFYGARFTATYRSVVSSRQGWQVSLKNFGVDRALLPSDAPMAATLRRSGEWRVVHTDAVATLFMPVSPAERVSVGSADSAGRNAIAGSQGT